MSDCESRRSFLERITKGTGGFFAAAGGGAVGALAAKSITEKSSAHNYESAIDNEAVKAVEMVALKQPLLPREIIELYLQQIRQKRDSEHKIF